MYTHKCRDLACGDAMRRVSARHRVSSAPRGEGAWGDLGGTTCLKLPMSLLGTTNNDNINGAIRDM